MPGRVLVGQSGGPTAVINASLAGLVTRAREVGTSVLGMQFGIEGFLNGSVIDLSRLSGQDLRTLHATPSSALGSTRKKLSDDELPTVLAKLRDLEVRYLFLIGGNDTMDTINRVCEYCNSQGYEITGVGIPKTVDNDLFGTDHTPGFPSAAWYNALSVRQAGVLARDMQRVDQFVVYQTVGRDAGWLAAATACAKQREDDAPHLIYVPEQPFDKDAFLEAAERCVREYGWVSIVCGEGITFSDGTPVSASTTRDNFDNVEFGAMGGTSAAFALHRMLSDTFGWRGEFQVTESLAMCAADRTVSTDVNEAYRCGGRAFELAYEGTGGVMVSIEVPSRDPYRSQLGTIPLADVARQTRAMPPGYLKPRFVSEAFLDYMKPLLPEPPSYLRLY